MSRGIPTVYAGVRFRSRTEARWAAFFDALGWPWAYEPIDLDGYVPDFVLGFDAGPVLLEVKADHGLDDLRRHCRKLESSGWHGQAIIVGATILSPGDDSPILGLIGEPMTDVPGETHAWGEARLFTCLSCGGVSVLSADYSWHCRRCGQSSDHIGSARQVAGLWIESGNRVQWSPTADALPATRDVTRCHAAVTRHVTAPQTLLSEGPNHGR